MVGKALTAKELQSMKVADLRNELRAHGLKVSGLRQELIDRLAKHFKSSKRRAPTSVASASSTKAAQAETRPNLDGLARQVDMPASVQPEDDYPSEGRATPGMTEALAEPKCDKTLVLRVPTEEVAPAHLEDSDESVAATTMTSDSSATEEVVQSQLEVSVESVPAATVTSDSSAIEEIVQSQLAVSDESVSTATVTSDSSATEEVVKSQLAVSVESGTAATMTSDSPATEEAVQSQLAVSDESGTAATMTSDSSATEEVVQSGLEVSTESVSAAAVTSDSFATEEVVQSQLAVSDESGTAATMTSDSSATEEIVQSRLEVSTESVSAATVTSDSSATGEVVQSRSEVSDENITASIGTLDSGSVVASHQETAPVSQVNSALQVKVSASPAKAQETPASTTTSNVRKDVQSTPLVRKNPKRRAAPRAIAFSPIPISPSAVLAPEVTAPFGTPSKDDAMQDSTPLKDARKGWRELCAREAACLRSDRRGSSSEEANEDDTQQEDAAHAADQSTAKRAISRSPSQDAHKAKVSKVVLRKPRSMEHGSSSKPQGRSDRAASRSPSSDAKSQSQSSARCSPERGPRNCLWGRRAPKPEADASKRCESEQASTLPTETSNNLQDLQKRANELRSELLNTFKARASSQSGGPTRSPSRKSRSPHRTTQLPVASTPDACQDTPKSVAPSPAGLVATPRLMQRLAAANLLSPGPSPRNLSSALQDVAFDSKSSCREQAMDSKQRMLVQLTEQMQKCLARLQDPNLDDSSREKYQSIASSLRGQMDKISSFRLLGSSPAIRRGGC